MSDPVVRIGPPAFEDRGEWVRVTYPVAGLAPDRLWYEVEAGYRDYLAESCDAPVVALLILAMRQGSPVEVDGTMSRRLWWNLGNTVMPVLRIQNPTFPTVSLEVESFTEGDSPTGTAVVTGLSCGVDSFCVAHDHLLRPGLRPEDRITHFLFNHLGSHGVTPEESEERGALRWARVRAAAAEMGRPVIRTRSNQQEFFGYYPDILMDFEATLVLRNASVAHLLQKGVRRWILASGLKWTDLRISETRYQGMAEPVLVRALSTERTELVVAGCELSRVEKTRRVASLEVARNHLDVCIRPGQGLNNCSACSKCARTLLTLDFLGELDAFHRTFELELYRRNRDRHIVDTLSRKEEMYPSEILQLMEKAGYRPPTGIRVRVGVTRAFRSLPRSWQDRARGVRRRIVGLGERTRPSGSV